MSHGTRINTSLVTNTQEPGNVANIVAVPSDAVLWMATHSGAATHCNALQRTATRCNALQRTAAHCSALQHTLQHTLKHRCLASTPTTLVFPVIHWMATTMATHSHAATMATHSHAATLCNALQRTLQHRCLAAMPTTLLFPVLEWIASVILLIYFLIVLWYLASAGTFDPEVCVYVCV